MIPLREFNQQNIDDYYSSIVFPKANALYLDFFDGELNYIGSQDLKKAGNQLETLTKMGSFNYN